MQTAQPAIRGNAQNFGDPRFFNSSINRAAWLSISSISCATSAKSPLALACSRFDAASLITAAPPLPADPLRLWGSSTNSPDRPLCGIGLQLLQHCGEHLHEFAQYLPSQRCMQVHLKNGTVSLKVTRAAKDNQAFIRWDVSDAGIEIAKEDMKRLFQPSIQVDSSATRRHGGT